MNAKIMDGNLLAREMRGEWKARAAAFSGARQATGFGGDYCGQQSGFQHLRAQQGKGLW